jgi:hypothetical protein
MAAASLAVCTDCDLILDDLVVVERSRYVQSRSRPGSGGVDSHSNNEGTEEGRCNSSVQHWSAAAAVVRTIGHGRVRIRHPFSIELPAVSLRRAAEVWERLQMRPCRRLWIWAPSRVNWERCAGVSRGRKEGRERKSAALCGHATALLRLGFALHVSGAPETEARLRHTSVALWLLLMTFVA